MSIPDDETGGGQSTSSAPAGDPAEPPGADDMRQLMKDGKIESIVVSLQAMYPDAKPDVEDQVINAVLKYFQKCGEGHDIDEPAKWIYTVARRLILNLLNRHRNREKPLDSRPEVQVEAPDGAVMDAMAWQSLKGRISQWESGRLRTITLIKLEAIFHGDPMTNEEVAVDAGKALGQAISPAVVATYWGRGKKKLLAELTAHIEETGINPIDGSEN